MNELCRFRLKCVVSNLKNDKWVRSDVIKNIEYAASVLRNVYSSQSRSAYPHQTFVNEHLYAITALRAANIESSPVWDIS